MSSEQPEGRARGRSLASQRPGRSRAPADPTLLARVGLIACALLLVSGGQANSQLEVPPDRQVLILTRALAYDSELPARAGKDISIGILTRPGHAASEAMGTAMLKAFKILANVKIQGLSLVVRPLSFTTAAALGSAVVSHAIDAIYVCAGLEADLPAISEVTRKRHVISFGSSEDQVTRGLALGVFPVEARPTIVLNLTAARSEGASFTSELLRIAKVLK
jgi:hypothetical protein